MKYIKPNFKKNILNISATFAEYLGCGNNNPTIKIIKDELKNNYKNIVFIIFDGMGIHPLKTNLRKDSFIRKNIKTKLTSTFPSTTTNATTTMLTNRYPLHHGWLGWSVHFEDLSRSIDIYLAQDSYTKEKIDPNFIFQRLPISAYYESAKTDYVINRVVPPYFTDGLQEDRHNFEKVDEMFSYIKEICLKDGKQFIYTYCPEPDATMHEYGVSSKEAKKVIEDLNEKIENLAKNTKDTLFVITADHGQTDVSGYINLYENTELLNLLKVKPYLEPRATAFKIKDGKDKEFIKLFKKCYGKDFKLYKTENLISQNYFGQTDGDNKNLLGDYIAVCKNNKVFRFCGDSHYFKGHHTSLGKEMLVPLIIFSTKGEY